MRLMTPEAPEQSMKLIKSTGRQIASNNPAGSERHSLQIRLSSKELLVYVDLVDGNLIIAIVAILAGAGLVLALILT
jgi:hypothetical protein